MDGTSPIAKSEENMATKEEARVLVVDDHPIVREGYVALISKQPTLTVCGQAEDVAQAMAAVEEHHPDIVLIDISLGNDSGLDVVKQIHARYEGVKLLVVSVHDDSLYAERALQVGAMGYINKQEATSKLIDAIRQVLEGEIYLSERVVHRVLQRVAHGEGDVHRNSIESLSNRELQVFELIGQGLTTRRIASRLNLSPKTVETHRANIKTKLSLHNGAELTRRAVQWVLENR